MNQNQISQSQPIKTSRKISTKDLVFTGMFTALICVLAPLEIPTQPIPFTLGLFAIFITGALLSPRFSLFAVIAYLLLGGFGMPVFAGFRSGFQSLTGPTGGFLMAYPVMAIVTSLFIKYSKKFKIIMSVAGMLVSLVLCYLIGSLWFTYLTDNSFYTALTLCVFPFVLFDLVKIVLAITLSLFIRKSALRFFNQ